MATLTPSSLIQKISGKTSRNETIIYRTRNGRTHAYIMHNPYKGEFSDSQKNTINNFAEASKRYNSEINDPQKLQFWQQEYNKHLKKTKNFSATSKIKRYSTLRGFIIASIMQQLKQN